MHNNYNTKLPSFQEIGLEVYNIKNEIINDIATVILQVKTIKDEHEITCPNCGSTKIYKKGIYVRTIRYVPIFNRQTIIKYDQQRFICQDCKKSFNDLNRLTEKYSTIASDLKVAIIDECKTSQSLFDISNRFNISHVSVYNKFHEIEAISRNKLTEIICIDEFKADTEYGKYACVIGNPVGHEVLDVLPMRTQEYISNYLCQINESERNIVKYIVTDLCEAYRTIARIHFPNAIHVADRFHWIKKATEAFNAIRISEMNLYRDKAKIATDIDLKRDLNKKYSILKSNARIFLANKYRKEDYWFDKYTKTKIDGDLKTIRQIIEYMLNSNETLDKAYRLLQSLYKISVQSDYDNYFNDINEWFIQVKESKLHKFKTVASTYRSWRNEIRNSFIINPITKTRINNGFIEGINNTCKVTKRKGYGYRKFDNLRNMIMLNNKNNIILRNK